MSNIVLSSGDIVNGKKGKSNFTSAFTQPLQFIPRDEKDEDWNAHNLDFLEYQGLRQIFKKAPHFAKNFNLAHGIIDKSDYVGTGANENQELLENLWGDNDLDTNLDLKFYPMIPSFINTMRTEFAKRNSKIMFMTADEYSYNEMLAAKTDEISNVLLKEAEQKMLQKLIDAGHDPQNPEDAQMFQEELNPEKLKTLPEIQEYYSKNYRSMITEWASHQYEEDSYRFSMPELKERNFTNSLITDSAYFHFPMYKNDYGVEIWNPMYTFVFKSPETKYTSQAYAAGNVKLMTIPEVIDKFGEKMSEDQQKSLELIYPSTNARYGVSGVSPESYYDNSKSHDWNVDGPSIAMREVTSVLGGTVGGMDALSILMNQDRYVNDKHFLLRVTTGYWKSQRRIGHLTQIKSDGSSVIKIVDEDYEVTDHPVYNNTLIKNRNPETLIFGEHIDWIWINQTYGGVKIGPNIPSYASMPASTGVSGLQPIYIGTDSNKVGPLKYQFKGDNNLYGCKLPVEGATFSDYNTRSVCAVDILKPFQIGYNVVNNQIADILMDELGTIVAFDQNQLPQESLGEDWGKGNYAKAWVAMKNFNMLPLDRRLANTEGASGQQALQQLDLSQTQRLMSRIQLGTYFKNEGLGLMGITPQRLGQSTGRQTATGVEENLNSSYNQTEMYFIQFSDYLMPRVEQMRTDLAQYYQSSNPSVRLQYMTSKDEKVNFQINGTDLLLRDFNVHAVSNATNRNVVEELRKLLITNNTAGGTIYQLGNLLTADSLGEINTILKSIEQKSDAQRQQEHNQEQAMDKQRQDSALQEKRLELEHEEREAEKDRRRDLAVAEIRAAGYSGAVDLNGNQQNDFLDNLEKIRNQDDYQQSMGFEREKETNRSQLARDKNNLERDKMNTQLRVAELGLAVARENKTGAELKKKQMKTTPKKK